MTSSTSADNAVDPVPDAQDSAAGDQRAPVEVADPAEIDRSLAVLGLIAQSELAAFSRLAADAALAPSLDLRLELSRLAGVALERLEQVGGRVGELGGDLQPVMAPYVGVLVEFDRRTVPGSWWERLLKSYVGYGVADDFARIVSSGVDLRTHELVVHVLGDDGHASLVVDSLTEASRQDATLASRLALWGRRLVGESLGVVQRVVAQHPPLSTLLEEAMAEEPGQGDAQQRLFAVLTADHSRRMERLGLTP